MLRRTLPLALCLTLAGCGQPAEEKALPVDGGRQVGAAQQQQKAENSKDLEAAKVKPQDLEAAKVPLKTLYQTKDADFWGQLLLDADPKVSEAAALALKKLGREGIYYLLRGMADPQEHVRYH